MYIVYMYTYMCILTCTHTCTCTCICTCTCTGYPSTLGDRQIPTWVDYDGHDAAIFDLPNSRLTAKVQSSNRVTEVSGKVVGEASDTQSEGNRVTFYMGDPDTE